MAKVTMPQLGESVAEGTIGKWLKQPGDKVAKYEPLLEVITDKVNAEVPSPVEGILREILVEEGETVPNNAEIAVIETADEAGSGANAEAVAAEAPTEAVGTPSRRSETPSRRSETPGGGSETPSRGGEPPAPAFGPAGSDERPERVREEAAAATSPTVSSDAPAQVGLADLPGDLDARMTPAVRRLLREHALTPAHIVGTGTGGRITRDDVIDFVEAQRTGAVVGGQRPLPAGGAAGTPSAAPVAAPAAAPTSPAAPAAGRAGAAAPAGAPGPGSAPASTARTVAAQPVVFPAGADEVLVPMTQMRKGISAQMTRALAVPHAYVHMEVDATALVRRRESAKRDYQAREGLSLSYVPFVVKAAVAALKHYPTFNAHWTEPGLLAKRRLSMGVAVAVEDGLIVPVVRDVDQLSINGINHAIGDVAARARAGKLRVDDFGGGTFTIDNTGWFGSNLTMPIINVPEVAILTMEAITKRPVVVETPDGDVIAIRPVMNMVLAIDHRANDGAQAAAFLGEVKAWLEAVGPETPID